MLRQVKRLKRVNQAVNLAPPGTFSGIYIRLRSGVYIKTNSQNLVREKNQMLKKEGKKISQGNDDKKGKKEKRGEKTGKRG